jgi:hypothetical protein
MLPATEQRSSGRRRSLVPARHIDASGPVRALGTYRLERTRFDRSPAVGSRPVVRHGRPGSEAAVAGFGRVAGERDSSLQRRIPARIPAVVFSSLHLFSAALIRAQSLFSPGVIQLFGTNY